MHPRHSVGQTTSGSTDAGTGVSDFFGSIPGPYQAGQQLGKIAADAIGSLSSGLAGASDAAQTAQQSYQDQAQRAADLLKQQQMQASGSAQGAASNLGGIVLIAAGVIVLALFLTRK